MPNPVARSSLQPPSSALPAALPAAGSASPNAWRRSSCCNRSQDLVQRCKHAGHEALLKVRGVSRQRLGLAAQQHRLCRGDAPEPQYLWGCISPPRQLLGGSDYTGARLLVPAPLAPNRRSP